MKYINFENAGVVIFEDHQVHKDIAEKFPNDKVLSAGFMNAWAIGDDLIVGTHGESVTLKASNSDSLGGSNSNRLSVRCTKSVNNGRLEPISPTHLLNLYLTIALVDVLRIIMGKWIER